MKKYLAHAVPIFKSGQKRSKVITYLYNFEPLVDF